MKPKQNFSKKFAKYAKRSFFEYCNDCGSEVVLSGYKEQPCPVCGVMLLPCALCDACSDNACKIFANSCKECPFDKKYQINSRFCFF